MLTDLLRSGKALEKFEDFVAAQGGNPRVTREERLLPAARIISEVTAHSAGYVQAIHAEKVGQAAMLLGAGREKKESQIDPAAGLILHKKVGDAVNAGETLAVLHTNGQKHLDEVKDIILSSYTIGNVKPHPKPLVYGVIPENVL